MQTTTTPDANSHAGFYVASTGDKADLKGAAQNGKAFGLYANGVGFECATAYRAFDQPLKVGQSFSFLMEHGDIVKKFDEDAPGYGSIGLTLRASTDSAGTDDYNKEMRFEIGYYKEGSVYKIYDGEGTKELDIPLSAGALAVTLTLGVSGRLQSGNHGGRNQGNDAPQRPQTRWHGGHANFQLLPF